jgi:hypothetical protein
MDVYPWWMICAILLQAIVRTHTIQVHILEGCWPTNLLGMVRLNPLSYVCVFELNISTNHQSTCLQSSLQCIINYPLLTQGTVPQHLLNCRKAWQMVSRCSMFAHHIFFPHMYMYLVCCVVMLDETSAFKPRTLAYVPMHGNSGLG